MDPLEQMLITKYGLKPDAAKAYAAEIKANKAPEAASVQRDVAAEGAKTEIDRMAKLQKKFELYTDIQKTKDAGGKVGPAEEKFYQSIRGKHDEIIKARGAEAPQRAQAQAALPVQRQLNFTGRAGDRGGLQGAIGAGQPTMPPEQLSQLQSGFGAGAGPNQYTMSTEVQNAPQQLPLDVRLPQGTPMMDPRNGSLYPAQGPRPTGPEVQFQMNPDIVKKKWAAAGGLEQLILDQLRQRGGY